MRLRPVPVAIAIVLPLASCGETSGPSDAGCNRGTLNHGTSVSGTLASGSCKGTSEFGQRYVEYTTTVSSGQRYLFTLRSDAAWRPILQLINSADPLAGAHTGWSDELAGTGAHSQLMFVSPYNGAVTLRVTAGAVDNPGAFTLQSRQCGGSDVPIRAGAVFDATIDANDCVMHNRFAEVDSAHADTFILYLGRYEAKTITIKARGTSAGVFKPAFVLTGPFIAGSSTSKWAYAVSSSDSLSIPVEGGSTGGDYMLAVMGAAPDMYGDYALTVGPTAP
ncbi:MAG TPA: hypothetical protein VG432_01545 [Gemmatimonadaceae bacterium]|nr:hypothetical protein [Gemmatimonadaceae bacterium]